ncbi:two-on-two hemoglobin-3 [Pyrus ussuriensis x Pyrus communis]|uniref:Two-on-two hemoglobin-3 n=1 Tax=Pyrus ussuriensis x Pyrus communis TaxID=2448454 RepID=A0A5N5F4B1_9ROSA|nr:two-on-two hemoglobin-3 [Pyrus ussuriensis x Pyrus communis]
MHSLQAKVIEWSNVDSADAFAISEANLVYDDEHEWFWSIFINLKKEDAIQNQYEFFMQIMEGPNLSSQRRGYVRGKFSGTSQLRK